MRADVLVVGAGASGASLSYLLARKGFDVLVVERKREIGRPHHCSGILGLKAIKELVHFNESWVISEIRWALFRSPGGVELRVDRGSPLAFVIDRTAMDKELVELASSEGAEVLLSTPFKGLQGGRALIKGGDVQYDLLVGADGAASTVARQLGLKDISAELGINVRVSEGPSEGYVVQVREGSWFSWWQPWKDGGKRGALGLLSHPVLDWTEATGYTEGGLIPRRSRSRVVFGRVALVGDSAGQIKPVSRGGVYMLSRAVKVLSEVIKSHFEGNGDLMSYERWWKKVIRSEVLPALVFRGWLERMRKEDIDKLFRKLRRFEGILNDRFDTDAQLEPVKGIGVNVIKFIMINPRALVGALSELVQRG